MYAGFKSRALNAAGDFCNLRSVAKITLLAEHRQHHVYAAKYVYFIFHMPICCGRLCAKVTQTPSFYAIC